MVGPPECSFTTKPVNRRNSNANITVTSTLLCRRRSAVNAIGTSVRADPIKSGVTQWRVDGKNEMDTVAENGGNPPSVTTRFNLGVENEQADAGRDGRTCLVRPNSQARTGTGETHFPCPADHGQGWQPYPV